MVDPIQQPSTPGPCRPLWHSLHVVCRCFWWLSVWCACLTSPQPSKRQQPAAPQACTLFQSLWWEGILEKSLMPVVPPTVQILVGSGHSRGHWKNIVNSHVHLEFAPLGLPGILLLVRCLADLQVGTTLGEGSLSYKYRNLVNNHSTHVSSLHTHARKTRGQMFSDIVLFSGGLVDIFLIFALSLSIFAESQFFLDVLLVLLEGLCWDLWLGQLWIDRRRQTSCDPEPQKPDNRPTFYG